MIAGRPRPTLLLATVKNPQARQPGPQRAGGRPDPFAGQRLLRTQLHARLPHKWLAQYLHTAIDLDPQLFAGSYLAGAAMLVYNGQRIVPDMILAANGVLARGRQAFPFDWEIPFQLGFNLLYELPMDATPDDPAHPRLAPARVEVSASDRPL